MSSLQNRFKSKQQQLLRKEPSRSEIVTPAGAVKPVSVLFKDEEKQTALPVEARPSPKD